MSRDLVSESAAPTEHKGIELTKESLAAHEGRAADVEAPEDDMDRTLNATRNSNSLDGIEEPYPETTMDEEFARAEDHPKPSSHPQYSVAYQAVT